MAALLVAVRMIYVESFLQGEKSDLCDSSSMASMRHPQSADQLPEAANLPPYWPTLHCRPEEVKHLASH
jgi:hypothetical protein